MFYHGRSLQTTFNKSKFARVSYVSTVQPDFSPWMWITPRLGTSFCRFKGLSTTWATLKKKLLELFTKLSWLFKLPGLFPWFFKICPNRTGVKKQNVITFSRKLQQPTRAPELVPTTWDTSFHPPKNPKDPEILQKCTEIKMAMGYLISLNFSHLKTTPCDVWNTGYVTVTWLFKSYWLSPVANLSPTWTLFDDGFFEKLW